MEKTIVIIGVSVCIVAGIQIIIWLIRFRPQKSLISPEEKQHLMTQAEEYKALLQDDPNSEKFLTLSELYQKLGVSEEAMDILRQGLVRHPHFIEARLALARVELTQGHVEQARQELRHVVLDEPQHFLAHKLLGEIAMKQQDYEDAVVHFGAAYTLKPDEEEPKAMLEYLGSLLKRNVTTQFQQGEKK